MLPAKDAFSDDEGVDDSVRLPTINKLRRLRLREENEKLRKRNAEIDAMGQVLQGDVLAQVKRTWFSGGRWMFILSLMVVADSASASSTGLTELWECGDQCTFWLDTNKTMVKTGGPCTCSSLDLYNTGIAKIAKGTIVDMPNLQSLYLWSNEIAEFEPGWVRNVPNLRYLYLSANKIAKIANGTIVDMPNLQYLYLDHNEIAELDPGWVRNVASLRILVLSGNKIAKIAKGTIVDMPNLERLWLDDNEIAELEPGWVKNVPNLERLDIYDNPLGCVSGIADDVEIDPTALSYGFYETPRCPENCTINTYYDPDNHVCLSCPENTYTAGIGAVNCTAIPVMPTTTPAPLCDGETSPFFHAGATLCVPKDIHPVGALTELTKCGDECTFWLDTNKMVFRTGDSCACPRGPGGRWVDLSHKGITKIAKGTFSNLTDLEDIVLTGNDIAKLESDSLGNLPNLKYLHLSSNSIAKIAKGTVSNMPNLQYLRLSDNEIADIEPGVLNDLPNLRSLSLGSNKIAELKPGWVSNVPNLESLSIFNNPLGCVSGIADDVEIDTYALGNGFYETPRCPENCTINTYYNPDNHVCLPCPENTYTDGIGAVNCTALAAAPTTTTPAPLCDGEARPFSLAGDTLCVPNSLYPAPNVMHCVFEGTWADVVEHKHLYKTGGLGKKMRDVWKVWVCMEHACATDKTARVCFTFSEEHRVFVPWGYNSQLRVLKM